MWWLLRIVLILIHSQVNANIYKSLGSNYGQSQYSLCRMKEWGKSLFGQGSNYVIFGSTCNCGVFSFVCLNVWKGIYMKNSSEWVFFVMYPKFLDWEIVTTIIVDVYISFIFCTVSEFL